jgi:uncharacterized protein DUF5681
MAETTGRQQGGRWPKGVSGNAAGRPPGARHKATMAIEALLEGDAERLGRKVIEMALAGDTVALRLCLERIAPARKSSPVEVNLPPIASVADMPLALSAAIAAMAAGEISPDEAAAVAAVIEMRRKAIETVELEQRIRALEAKGSVP